MIYKVPQAGLMLGCDPELFLEKDGEVIGSEKVLPKNGIPSISCWHQTPKVVRDGVQAELNPLPSGCRALLGVQIASLFRTLKPQLKKSGVSIDIRTTVRLSKQEMESISEDSKKFGCSPSKNAHGAPKISVRSTNRSRSAGGHIHLGYSKLMDTSLHDEIAYFLDIILGNTCVLLDRNPGNVQRRKYYGRAGEYRSPSHGLEYRTLSNFWLRDYVLFSFVMGLARQAVSMYFNPYLRHEILSSVDKSEIANAINSNNFDLAMHNFQSIAPLLCQVRARGPYQFSLAEEDMVREFLRVVDDGIDKLFPEDGAIERWIALTDGHEKGWEKWLTDRQKSMKLFYLYKVRFASKIDASPKTLYEV